MSLLKELLKLREDEVIKPQELKVDNQVHSSLDAARDDDSIDSQCFGLELEDGSVVKVYVHEKDTEAFEEAVKKKLAEIDDIEQAIEDLEKDFEIIKIVWPDEDDQSQEKDDGEDEEDEEDDALNSNVDYSDDDSINAPDNFKNDNSTAYGKSEITAKESFGQKLTKKLLSELKATTTEEDDIDENDEDEDPDATQEPSSHKMNSKLDVGKASDWVVEKTPDDGLVLSNKHFKAEFTSTELLVLINKIADRQVARFKNDIGKIVYVFSPRGNDYVLKTPDFQTGFKIPKAIIDQILDED